MNAEPLRDKLRVALLPEPEVSALIAAPPRDTVIRRATIRALGPDVNQRFQPEDALAVGDEVLVNLMAAQEFGEEYVLPVGSILATFQEDG